MTATVHQLRPRTTPDLDLAILACHQRANARDISATRAAYELMQEANHHLRWQSLAVYTAAYGVLKNQES